MLRSFRTGEADRVVHLLTPGYGRVNVIAKGARRTTGKMGASLEPLTRLEVVLQPGRGDLAIVTSADIQWSGDAVRRDPQRAFAASAGIEAIVRLFPEPEPEERLYRGLQRFLEVIAEPLGNDPQAAAEMITLGFVLKLLTLAGWRPEIAACVRCGQPTEVYDAQAGCGYCAVCGSGSPLGPVAALAAARLILEPLGAVPVADSPERRQVARLCRETAEAHGGVRLRLLGQTTTAAS